MGSFDFLSSIIRLAWPALAVATFVVCLQIQKRNKGAAGVSLLVAGSVLVMLVSLASNLLQFLLLNEGLDYSSISGYFSIWMICHGSIPIASRSKVRSASFLL